MVSKNNCPIETTLQYLGKRWSLLIIRDLFMGKKRFKDFLSATPELSGKMLSDRLRELEKNNIVRKTVVSTSPLLIEYELTKKGKGLNKIIYELAQFGVSHLKSEVTKKNCSVGSKAELKKFLGIK